MRASIVVLGGDGIGPEVTQEAVRVLGAVAQQFSHTFDLTHALIGGAAIDACGTSLPPDTLTVARAADAILLGAVGGQKWDDPDSRDRPEMGLLEIRSALELYANLRPIVVQPPLVAASPLRADRLEGVDILFVRELTGGLYFGPRGRTENEAFDTCVYSTHEVERVARFAFRLARARRGKLASVDKANVLMTSRLWRNVVARLARDEFPDVRVEHILVDACAMHLLRRPGDFDVIVTENTFGDILTDEASVLAGSMGLIPSASIGDHKQGLYEPIHGSAPDIAGKGIANPMGAILSVALMLRHSLGLEAEAAAVETAVSATIASGCLTPDLAPSGILPASTHDVGSAVIAKLSFKGDRSLRPDPVVR